MTLVVAAQVNQPKGMFKEERALTLLYWEVAWAESWGDMPSTLQALAPYHLR